MYRIKIMAAVLLCGGLFSSCGEKDYNSDVENAIPHVVYTTTPTETKIFVGELLEEELTEGSYEFNVKYGLPLDKSAGMEASIGIDNSLIDAYGATTSQSLKPLPAEFISFPEGTVSIPAGSLETTVTFKLINVDRIPNGLYCIPVTIKSAKAGSGFSVHGKKNTAYYVVTKGIAVLKQVTGMSVVSASDEEPTDGGGKETVLDGNNSTFWHSGYEDPPKGNGMAFLPHWLIIDMGKPTAVARIETIRRANGDTGKFEYWINETSSNPNDAGWIQIAQGEYPTTGEPHLYTNDIDSPQKARYLKIVITTSLRGWPPVTAIVAINVYRWGY